MGGEVGDGALHSRAIQPLDEQVRRDQILSSEALSADALARGLFREELEGPDVEPVAASVIKRHVPCGRSPAFVAVGRGVSRLLVGAGVAAVLVAGYAALTAASHTTSAIARDIYGNVVTSDLLDPRPHVTTAYGVILELVAAILLLVSAIRLSGAPSLGEVPDDAGGESPALGSEQVGDARPD
jgi:hypothetical protein